MVVNIDPRTDPLWQKLVEQHESGVFNSPSWARALTETYNWKAEAYVIQDGAGNPQAGISFCRIEDLFGRRIVSLPFSDYCDPLVNDVEHWRVLIEELMVEQCPIVVRCLHNNLPLADERFAVTKQAKWHGIDLQPDFDTMWGSLHDSARRAIKKAQREGVVVRMAREKDELRTFFEMHLKVRKYKYRLLAQPYDFFENIWHHFMEAGNGFLLLAVYGEQIIGGTLFLEWKDTLYYKFNASFSSDLIHRPNDLLTWEGIKYGKEKGYTHFDFGLSDWDEEGLLRYKRKFATEEKTISFLRYSPVGELTQQQIDARNLLPSLTDILTDESVPDSVTEKAGGKLYRYFT